MTHEPDPIPDDLPIVEREVVRLVVLDARGEVLLFHTRDPWRPELGMWWELPGGGLEPGETYVEAGIRELREETGLLVDATQVGLANWRRRASFVHRDRRMVQNEVVAMVRLVGTHPAIDPTARMDYELEDYVDYRWWTVPEVVGSTEGFYPRRLPAILPEFLRGEAITEPFELRS